MNELNNFSNFSGLKLNKTKWEIASIYPKKCTGFKLLMLSQKPERYYFERQRECKKISYF